jgi:nucleotide-binding universal stress UspA family protein
MEVVRRTRRIVWIVRIGSLTTGEPFPRKRIVCGIDINAEGQAVLNYAAHLAAAWNSVLTLVHAIPGISDAVLARYGLEEDADIAMLPGTNDAMLTPSGLYQIGEIEPLPKAARRKIRAMAAHVRVPIQLEVSTGDPAECLRRAARSHCADLVIVGRGRHTNRWSTGANIGEIIARSDCPVITYRPRILTALTRGRMQRVRNRQPHAVVFPFERPSGLQPVQAIL